VQCAWGMGHGAWGMGHDGLGVYDALSSWHGRACCMLNSALCRALQNKCNS
jgi:hypothetical protein